jgi:hypothetical protein
LAAKAPVDRLKPGRTFELRSSVAERYHSFTQEVSV